MLIPFSIIKKVYLQILKNLAQFFAYPLFQISKKEYLQISKYAFHTNNFKGTIIQTILIKTIIQIDKHKAKYIITACIPKLP